MKWIVVATVDVPNLGPGPGVFEDSVLGMTDVLEVDRRSSGQVTLTVEAADEAEAQQVSPKAARRPASAPNSPACRNSSRSTSSRQE